jgi:phosphoglycerate dehydrogenase-like enzyme
MSTRTVVTFEASPEQREAISEILAPRGGVTYLADVPDDRLAVLTAAEAVLTWFPGIELADAPPDAPWRARFVQVLSAGVDGVPFAAMPPGATVASNAGAYATPVAEHALALTLALAKRLPYNHRRMEAGGFGSTPNIRLEGGVAAIVGFGGIGRRCARYLRALGMRIHALNRSGRTDEDVEFVGTLDDLKRVLEVAAVVVVTLPLTTATRGLIGAEQLAWMRPDAILVNVARGAIVQEVPLYERLVAYPEFSAGIDTWWREPAFGTDERFATSVPFLDLPNMIASPHNAGNVPGMLLVAARAAAANVALHLDGGRPSGLLDPAEYG